MRVLTVLNKEDADRLGEAHSAVVPIDGVPVTFAMVDVPKPRFEPSVGEHRRSVLVHTNAFSCNYRDKGFITLALRMPAGKFFAVGSEFVGTVEAVGNDVRSIRPGDRVIGQNHYSGAPLSADGPTPGIPTNSASKEYHVMREEKLAGIPDSMPTSEAAGFSLGAQTAYSMLRKLDQVAGAPVLVTSATSNTSLFAISALQAAGATVFATTTSRGFDDRLRAAGAHRVIPIGEEAPEFHNSTLVLEAAESVGGFASVIDPFFDLHVEGAVASLRSGGRYITCGFAGQTEGARRRTGLAQVDGTALLQLVFRKNVSIVGNCLGFAEDLERAIEDHSVGRLSCIVDSVHTESGLRGFLHRTFNDRSRFGKVVMEFAEQLDPERQPTAFTSAGGGAVG